MQALFVQVYDIHCAYSHISPSPQFQTHSCYTVSFPLSCHLFKHYLYVYIKSRSHEWGKTSNICLWDIQFVNMIFSGYIHFHVKNTDSIFIITWKIIYLLSIYLSICLSIYLSAYRSLYLCVCVHTHVCAKFSLTIPLLI